MPTTRNIHLMSLVWSGLITTIIGRVGKEILEEKTLNGDADVIGIMRGDSEVWRKQSLGMVAQTYQEDNRIRLYIDAK